MLFKLNPKLVVFFLTSKQGSVWKYTYNENYPTSQGAEEKAMSEEDWYFRILRVRISHLFHYLLYLI